MESRPVSVTARAGAAGDSARRRSPPPRCRTRSSRQRIENQPWPAEPSAVLPPPPAGTAESLPEFTLPAPRPGRPPPERAPARSGFRTPIRASPRTRCLEAPASLAALADLRPLGQIHESFIIAAGRDGLWIIDQHVAHERVLFEKVLRERAAGSVGIAAAADAAW